MPLKTAAARRKTGGSLPLPPETSKAFVANSYSGIKLYKLNQAHLRGVPAAGGCPDNARIPAVAVGVFRRDFVKQLFADAFLGYKRENQTLIRKSGIFRDGYHLFRH